MPVTISKGEMWDLLGDKALNFATWLNSGSPEAAAIKTMLENTEGLDLISPLVSGQLLPLLLALAVIDQAVMNRISARIAQETTSPSAPLTNRRFIITPTEALSEEAMRAWVLPYCTTSDPYISYNSDGIIVVELSGVCTAPGAQEVI